MRCWPDWDWHICPRTKCRRISPTDASFGCSPIGVPPFQVIIFTTQVAGSPRQPLLCWSKRCVTGADVAIAIDGARADIRLRGSFASLFKSCETDSISTHHYSLASSQIMTRIGVGSNPLQGLLTCGQFEMTKMTSSSIET